MLTHITVGSATSEGWRCLDDAGRVVLLDRSALDSALRDVRVGQRLQVEIRGGVVVRAALP